jgi:polar amino acid transport system permease protein
VSDFERAVRLDAGQGYSRRIPVGQVVLGVVVAVIVVAALVALGANKAFQWDVVGEYLLNPRIIEGLWMTLGLTLVSTVGAFVIGGVLAALQLSQNLVLRLVANGYVWFFRSVPLLVQLLFWFNIGYLFPRLALGIPFGPELFAIETKDLISTGAVAVIGLTIHESAYAAEIIRGGLLSVPEGYVEAAKALGFSRLHILLRVQLPDAMRAIIPPAGNLLISTLKSTSMVSVIAVTNLLYAAQLIYNQNFLVIPLLVVTVAWYLFVTVLLSIGQNLVERRFAGRARRGAGGRRGRAARVAPPAEVA